MDRVRLMHDEKTATTLERLAAQLQGPKPGLPAQLQMAPDHRRHERTYKDVGDSCLKAGVLILLYPMNGRLHLALTLRSTRVAHHQAQISFPGGSNDAGESLVETALREAREELDVAPDSVRVLGELTPLYVQPSNYCIYPVVAATDHRPDFRAAPDEVEEVIEVPLDHLLDPGNARREHWALRGLEVTVPFYVYREHKIWGATAMILAELLDLIHSK
jgi:8-oxo-dGTP pyrophosphatase MutT (NUDIX family)